LIQAAPGTPGPARRKPNYCDPNLAHRQGLQWRTSGANDSEENTPGKYRKEELGTLCACSLVLCMAVCVVKKLQPV
jgi:hypothetical protein